MEKSDKESILVSRGFLWGPSPEIYRGVAGFYDMGPLGKLVKNRLEQESRRILSRHGFFEVESPALMPKIVWEASGHLERFIDMMAECKKCGAKFKIEEGKKCPSCGGEFKEPIEYNLMMKTEVGTGSEMYLRPETATTTYLLFPRLYRFFRGKMPVKVFQIGKAYRNEISPRQGVIRLREFTQMEAQVFTAKSRGSFPGFEPIKKLSLALMPHTKKKPEEMSLESALKKGYIKSRGLAWCLFVADEILKGSGLSGYRFRQHGPDEMSHYAEDAWDIEVKINKEWVELCGVHDRSDYDLKRHSKFSGQGMKAGKETPKVLEIAFGLERIVYALLMDSIKKQGERNLMKISKRVSPFHAAIFPLLSKPKMKKLAGEVYDDLSREFQVFYDDSGSIGRRYRRQDEIGTPFCITIDHQSLEDGTVTIRERDSMKQERVEISALKEELGGRF